MIRITKLNGSPYKDKRVALRAGREFVKLNAAVTEHQQWTVEAQNEGAAWVAICYPVTGEYFTFNTPENERVLYRNATAIRNNEPLVDGRKTAENAHIMEQLKAQQAEIDELKRALAAKTKEVEQHKELNRALLGVIDEHIEDNDIQGPQTVEEIAAWLDLPEDADKQGVMQAQAYLLLFNRQIKDITGYEGELRTLKDGEKALDFSGYQPTQVEDDIF